MNWRRRGFIPAHSSVLQFNTVGKLQSKSSREASYHNHKQAQRAINAYMHSGAQFTFSAITQSRILHLGHGATHSGLPASRNAIKTNPWANLILLLRFPSRRILDCQVDNWSRHWCKGTSTVWLHMNETPRQVEFMETQWYTGQQQLGAEGGLFKGWHHFWHRKRGKRSVTRELQRRHKSMSVLGPLCCVC